MKFTGGDGQMSFANEIQRSAIASHEIVRVYHGYMELDHRSMVSTHWPMGFDHGALAVAH